MKFLNLILIITFSIGCKEYNSQKENIAKNENTISKILNPKDELIGEFAFEKNGKAKFKITKTNELYYAQIITKEGWSKKSEINEVADSKLTKVFGDDWKSIVKFGLANKGIGIFKMYKGGKYKNKIFQTEYFLIYAFTRTELYKL